MKKVLSKILSQYRTIRQRTEEKRIVQNWRKQNAHNRTKLVEPLVNTDRIHVGNYTYGPISAIIASPKGSLHIGNFCSIASNVTFVVSADHPTENISTFPFKTVCTQEVISEAISKGDIVIEDDVWLGFGATILSGVHIGQGAIIAAGSVVTKDVPPYAIAGGTPAKVIRYRFKQELIEALLKVDFSQLDEETVRNNIERFYEKLEDPKQLDGLPKKCSN